MKNRTDELLKGCGESLDLNNFIFFNCRKGDLCEICKSKISERLRCLEEVKEMIEKIIRKRNKDFDRYNKESRKDNFRKEYSDNQASKMLAILDDLEQLKAEIQAQINRIKEVGK